MPRSLFDPERAAGADRDDPPSNGGDRPLRVRDLANLIKTTLEGGIPANLRVVGEISNLSARNHWYFTLKDEDAVVSCVAWASTARGFGFTPGDGDEVVATGYVSHYPPQGRTQLYVSRLEPVGAGALEQQFRALCAELRGLGYFAEERKRPLPIMPRKIAIITSAGGAAIHDVVSTAHARCPSVRLLLVPAPVQGEGAAAKVAALIRRIGADRESLGIDAILVTRGGGSLEDLWAFNERVVADAVFECPLPVVAAIGHESDTTIIELVADRRAATPTQAAMVLVPEAAELRRQVEALGDRVARLLGTRIERDRSQLAAAGHRLRAVDRRVDRARVALERQVGRLARLSPVNLLVARRERVDGLARRLDRALRHRLDRHDDLRHARRRLHRAVKIRVREARAQWHALRRAAEAVDPRRVLQRGFTLTTIADGSPRSTGDVRHGDLLQTHLADGLIDSVVTEGNVTRGRSAPRGADQLDLFGGSA